MRQSPFGRAALASVFASLAACNSIPDSSVAPAATATVPVSGASSNPAATIPNLSSSPASSSAGTDTSGSSSSSSSVAGGTRTIAQIQVIGAPVMVFDHAKDQQEPDNYPDAQVTAWKEADGTVNLLIPHSEAYRMRGTDLEHLSIDPKKIFSSTQSGMQITENLYNYLHWMMGPYSLDGEHFYTLTHSEWYGCLLNGDCDAPATGKGAGVNSWANTINSLSSTNGGATWSLNTIDGNHVVAKTAYQWAGSEALSQHIYLHAMNLTGMIEPSRIIKEGNYFYSIANYVHRDFTRIRPAAGVFEAPMDKNGLVIIRTTDVSNPNAWQVWTSGDSYGAIENMNIGVFLPQQGGTAQHATQAQIVYDTNAQCFILIFTANPGAVYYMTTKSLANPIWSNSRQIIGTATMTTDPAGSVVGFDGANYPSVLDDSSAGFNYEFTSGAPQLFFSTSPIDYGGDNTARDLYRVQLAITYQDRDSALSASP